MFEARKHVTPHRTLSVRSGPEPIEAPELVDAKVTKLTLRNGLTCYTALGPNVERFFGASVFTPALWGMGEQHVLEHVVMSGSKRFPSPNIYSEFHTTSDAQPGACTYHNRTWYHASSFSDAGLLRITDALTDGMFNPLLSQDAFKTESFKPIREFTGKRSSITYPAGVVFNEMRQSYLHPNNLALRNAVAHLFPEALPQMDFAGSPEGIKKLSRHYDKLVKYHSRFYYPENTVFFVAHPGSPEPVLKTLEKLPLSGKSHNYAPPIFDLSLCPREVHISHPAPIDLPRHASNLVILIPIAPPANVKELLFYHVIWDSLFHLDRNAYTLKWNKAALESRPVISNCQPLALGAQHFFAIQVDEMAPGDRDKVRSLIFDTYSRVHEKNVPFSTFNSALGGLRHYFSGASDNVEEAFWRLTETRDSLPHLNLLTQSSVASALYRNAKEIYPEFCRFTEKLFASDALIFSQNAVARKSRVTISASSAKPELHLARVIPWDVQVPEYPLLTKKIADSAKSNFVVEHPFDGNLRDAIVRVPTGDQNRIHLNIAFDLSALRSDLWLHAIFILNTLTENRSGFRSQSHVSVKFNALSSPSSNTVLPVNRNGCHFFMGVSVFPDELKTFLRMLDKIFAAPDYTKNSYLHGLEYQRGALFPDIYDPSASDQLDDAFMTRALAYYDPGYRLREALVGFEALPKFNRILSAWTHNNFKESEARMYTVINYLFSGSAVHFQYSAPSEIDGQVADSLRAFYEKQRRWDKNEIYHPSRKLARNDLLIASSVTNIAARVFHLPEFSADHEAALAYLRGFLVSKELSKARGFYRNFIRFDPTTSCLVLMAQRGSTALAPFKIYDSIPDILDSVKLTSRQLKGLQTGALISHLKRLSDEDPHSKMLRRVRLSQLGMAPTQFQEYAEGILSAGRSSFRSLAEILAQKRPSSRNIVLTGENGAREISQNSQHINFGNPVVCHL